MNLRELFNCFVLLHESATEFIELLMDMGPDDASNDQYDKVIHYTYNYLEEDHRGTYMNYGYHLD
jgi:hypothetical protein